MSDEQRSTVYSRAGRVERIVQEALDQPTSQRAAYLDSACADDPTIRNEVERLLAAPATALLSFLETPAIQRPGGAATAEPGAPTRVGRYRVKRKVGEGGMGAVYEAEQDQPRRTVALKLISASIAGGSLLRRFEREAEILGRLQHPGIAHIYEAGVAEVEWAAAEGGLDARSPQLASPLMTRQPFLAMEFIHGAPLNHYVRTAAVGAKEVLDLVARIADAVHYAHLQGVVHRDLKPGNIVVDEKRQPKVLDFGVARVTESDLQTATLQTAMGQLVGTVPYMSPEQVVGDPSLIDARSDVYSLGVILYELLAQRLPYEVRERSLPDAVRIIREEEPTRLSSVQTNFRGDIETIVGKALEKDRARRYQSAAELASDIRRYLCDEPIVARPASAWYQLRKLVRRNRGLAIGMATTLIALIAGLIGTTRGLLTTAAERDLAVAARGRAELLSVREGHARAAADASAERANAKAAEASAALDFMRRMLSAADTGQQQGKELSVREVLERAVKEIDDGSLQGQPLVEAPTRGVIGDTLRALGRYADAEPQLRRALDLYVANLGEESIEAAGAMNRLGEFLVNMERIDAAEPLLRRALDLRRRLLPNNHRDLLNSINNVAQVLRAQRKLEEAVPLFTEVVERRRAADGPRHPLVGIGVGTLGEALYALGRVEEAATAYAEALSILREHLPTHIFTAITLNNYGRMLQFEHRYAEAEPVLREAHDLLLKLYGQEHPETAGVGVNLSTLLRAKGGHSEESVELTLRGIKVFEKEHRDSHVNVIGAFQHLAAVYLDMDRPADAEAILRRATDALRTDIPGKVLVQPELLAMLCDALRLQQRWADAEAAILEARQLATEPSEVRSVVLLAEAQLALARGAHETVERDLRAVLDLRRQLLKPDHWRIGEAESLLGAWLTQRGVQEEGARLLRAGAEKQRANPSAVQRGLILARADKALQP